MIGSNGRGYPSPLNKGISYRDFPNFFLYKYTMYNSNGWTLDSRAAQPTEQPAHIYKHS